LRFQVLRANRRNPARSRVRDAPFELASDVHSEHPRSEVNNMMKRLSTGLLIGILGLGVGCGSGGGSKDPDCDKDGFICNPSGFPYVQAAVATSSLCGGLVADCDLAKNPPAGATTASLSQPVAGKLCLEGFIASGYQGAGLFLKFSTEKLLQVTANSGRDVEILKTFDATSLGITQVDFTIDSPLTGSIGVIATTTSPPVPASCPDQGIPCTSFDLVTTPGSGMAMSFTQPGSQVAPFANFESTGGETFDTTALEDIRFYIGVPGDYSFCISDFKFLNAAGAEVRP
jgi:hypothetical protein